MAQIIKVSEVTENKSKDGKTYFIITDSAGAKFGLWGTPPGGLVNGSTIEAEVEVKGRYNNIKDGSIKVLTVGEQKPVAEPANKGGYQYRGKSPEELAVERISIERQVSAKLAIEFAFGEKPMREMLINAEAIYKWIHDGVIPPIAESSKGRTSGFEPDNAGSSPAPAEPPLFEEAMKMGAKPSKITKEQLAQIQKIVTDKKIDKLQFNTCALETIGKEVDNPKNLLYDEAEKVIPALQKWATKA